MRSSISYYSDPGVVPIIDKLFCGKGASKYLAAALEHFCDSHKKKL